MPLPIPGIGAQGGNLALGVVSGVDATGQNAIIDISRQILYASKGRDFAEAARKMAKRIRDQIHSYLGR